MCEEEKIVEAIRLEAERYSKAKAQLNKINFFAEADRLHAAINRAAEACVDSDDGHEQLKILRAAAQTMEDMTRRLEASRTAVRSSIEQLERTVEDARK